MRRSLQRWISIVRGGKNRNNHATGKRSSKVFSQGINLVGGCRKTVDLGQIGGLAFNDKQAIGRSKSRVQFVLRLLAIRRIFYGNFLLLKDFYITCPGSGLIKYKR